MTEPNVLGNISPAKFLFDSGNTQIINLWRDVWASADTLSLMHEDPGTLNGQTYEIPANKIFYLLQFAIQQHSSDVHCNIQANTTADTATGGTTRFRIFQESTIGWQQAVYHNMCVKFVAGEFITPYTESYGGDMFYSAWGVECDA